MSSPISLAEDRISASGAPSPNEPPVSAASPSTSLAGNQRKAKEPVDSQETLDDKRRRNTEASARFRRRKKERETALSQEAKDVAKRVADLERECEDLRKENAWLKGLVIDSNIGAPAVPADNNAVRKKKRKREPAVGVEERE